MFNEEKRIKYPIKCFLPYGDVIVSDNLSTDRTVEIAKNLGAKVIKRKTHRAQFIENKIETDFIFNYVKTEWVFFGFADDMVPKTCLELYKKISQENKYKIVVQKRKTLLYDSNTEHSGLISIKFFRKDSLDFSNNTIHQMGKFASHVKPSEILYLPPIDEYSTYHFALETTESWLPKLNSYTSCEANSIKNKIFPLKIVFFPIFTFFEAYIFNGLWKYSIKGFILSTRFAIGTFVNLAKKYEKDNNLTLDSIEKSFSVQKRRLLDHSPRSNILQKTWAGITVFFISRIHKWYKLR